MKKRYPKVLLIEDDEGRREDFEKWLPGDARLVHASSAGQALGLIRRSKGSDFVGLLLDHDLVKRKKTGADAALSSSHVVDVLIHRRVDWADLPVLVHSMNPGMSADMVNRLDAAGFWVTGFSFADLDEERFLAWFAEAREEWEEE